MLVSCMIRKPFAYSLDGFTTLRAEAGVVADIPADLVPGLARAGCVETRAVAAAAENKAMAVPENKGENKGIMAVEALIPVGSVVPEDIEELRARVAALGVTVDRRWRETRLREELAKAGG